MPVHRNTAPHGPGTITVCGDTYGWLSLSCATSAYDPVDRNCNDEFMVGDRILAAPVVSQGMDRRMVYSPRVNGTSQ